MSTISKPNTFSANTSISSSEVNDNFDTLYNEVNGNLSADNLANNAVTTAKITDANVTTDKLASQAVTLPKVSTNFGSTTSTATLTVDAATYNIYALTAQAEALTIAAPTGSIQHGQTLIIRLKDNGTARALTWNAIFRAIGVTLPTTTVLSKTLYVGAIYNTTDTKWDVIAVAEEA